MKNRNDIVINDDTQMLIHIITILSNIVWNYSDHKDKISLDSIIGNLQGIIDGYNATHDKKINY